MPAFQVKLAGSDPVVNLYAVTAGFGQAAAAANQATENTGLTINIFWVIVAARH